MTRSRLRVLVFLIALTAPAALWAQPAAQPDTAAQPGTAAQPAAATQPDADAPPDAVTPAPQVQPLPPIRPLHPLQNIYRAFERVGEPRMLSFSANGALLACTNVSDEVLVFDVEAHELEWSWTYPEMLQTSLGELVWPWAPAAKGTWETGSWRLVTVPRRPGGWPGLSAAIFAPVSRKAGNEMALVHNASLSNSHIVVKRGEDVTLEPGALLGGYVHIYRVPDMALTRTIETEKPEFVPPEVTVLHGLSDVMALRYSPDGTLIATGSSAGKLALWPTEAGFCQTSVSVEEGAINSLDFSPSGDLVATIGESGVIYLWSVPGLAPVGELRGHGSAGRWVRFSPDGTRLASSAWDDTLRIWHVGSGAMEHVIPCSRIGVDPHFLWDTRGRSVLFAATRRDIGLIGEVAAATGDVRAAYQVDLAHITAFASSPRADLLAAADADGRILVWRLMPTLTLEPR